MCCGVDPVWIDAGDDFVQDPIGPAAAISYLSVGGRWCRVKIAPTGADFPYCDGIVAIDHDLASHSGGSLLAPIAPTH